MRKIYAVLVLGFSMLLLSSSQILKTQLRISVIDEIGNFTQGAEVTLYDSPEDYNNSQPAFGPKTTDKKGRVAFIGVSTGPYYIEATKGAYSNSLSSQLTDTLKPGRINKLNVIISE